MARTARRLLVRVAASLGSGTMVPVDDPLQEVWQEGALGPYRLERELRRGGMGVVWLARDRAGDAAAVKMALRADEHNRARFAQEIRATRSLDHPGIVRVREDGISQGRPWYAMDFISAVNLADVLALRGPGTPGDIGSLIQAALEGRLEELPPGRRSGLPTTTAVVLLARVCEAVAHAHARGVLHRDLKPSNIILSPVGDPVLCDFGVARDLVALSRLTAADEVVGTYTYIAPEQLAGEDIDERADVYALGAVLHESLCGRPPPRRTSGAETLREIAGLPAQLRAILYQSLTPDPRQRLPSAAALAAELRRFQRGEQVESRAPSRLRRIAHWADQHSLLSAFVLAALVVLVLLVLVSSELRARRSVQWQSPQRFELARLDDEVLAGRRTERGLRGRSGHWQVLDGVLQARRVPALLSIEPVFAAGLRVAVEWQGEPAPILVLGGDAELDGGWRLHPAGFERSYDLLSYEGQAVWLELAPLQRGPRRAELEWVEDSLRLRLDEREVLVEDVLLPPVGSHVGLRVEEMSPTPRLETLVLEVALPPALVPADRPLAALARVSIRSDPTLHPILLPRLQAETLDLHARQGLRPAGIDGLLRSGAVYDQCGDHQRLIAVHAHLPSWATQRRSALLQQQILHLRPGGGSGALAMMVDAAQAHSEPSWRLRYLGRLIKRAQDPDARQLVRDLLDRDLLDGAQRRILLAGLAEDQP